MLQLTTLHKDLLAYVENHSKLIEDISLISNFGITTWLDVWREGLVLTDKHGRAYLTKKGVEIVHFSFSEESL